MIHINDFVRIDRTGGQYESYRSFFEYYGLQEYLSRWNKIPSKAGMICKVLDVHSHHAQAGVPVYVLEELDSGSIYLYNDTTITWIGENDDGYVMDATEIGVGDELSLTGNLDYYLCEVAYERAKECLPDTPNRERIANAACNPGGTTLRLDRVKATVLGKTSDSILLDVDDGFGPIILTDYDYLDNVRIVLREQQQPDIDLLELLA